MAEKAISDLGASMPPDSVVARPSATIFNSAMIFTGLLVTAGVALFGAARGQGMISRSFQNRTAPDLGVHNCYERFSNFPKTSQIPIK